MAEIVLGIGTSHSPMLSTQPQMWHLMGEGDKVSGLLIDPENGEPVTYDELLNRRKDSAHRPSEEIFQCQWQACQTALATLSSALSAARPDVLVVVSDDQEEMLFDDNMPALQIYWGERIRLIPRFVPPTAPEVVRSWVWGYGDVEMELPIDAALGKHIIEQLTENGFDVASSRYEREGSLYGGSVGPAGDIVCARVTPFRRQGLGHGWTFIVKRLLDNKPIPMVPVMINTCYAPNSPTPRRCYQLGQALRSAISAWKQDARVCVMASGGLSHFVTDEVIDRLALEAMLKKDGDTLSTLPRNRLQSAASEVKNWIVCAAACEHLTPEIVDYVAVYRTEAGTGGGWAFMRWQ